jgi:hypothetical protein
MHTNELIDSIRSVLDERNTSVSAEVLALEYAKQCRDVNDRLGKIRLMLDSGGEIQALQMAEQPPRVVDLALALSFGGETAWQEFCRNHGHEVAVLVDARTLESLLEIQSKGISPDHPLYKEYRTAISKRDDESALNLIRVISRMNPGDDNAAKELKRLRHKSLQASLVNLNNNLSTDAALLLPAMAKVEESNMAEDYEVTPEWKEALGLRAQIRKANAWSRMPVALAEAEEKLQEGDWRQAALTHGEYSNLSSSYGHEPGTFEALEERSRTIQTKLDQFRAESERTAKIKHLIAEMERIAEDVETRTLTPLGLTPDFAAPLLEDLTRKIRQIEGLRGEFPLSSRMRIETTKARLEQDLQRASRSKRIRLVVGLAAIVCVLLVSAGFGVLAFRASSHTEQLVDLRKEKSTGGLRKLVDQIQKNEALLLKFAGLNTELAKAIQWLESIESKRSLANQELVYLEAKRRDNFADMESSEIFAKLKETGELISTLPDDTAEEANSQLTIIRNDGERVLTKRQEEMDLKARELATRWKKVLNDIDYATPAANIGKSIETAPAEIQPFLKLAEHENPILKLPASTASMMSDLDLKISEILKQVNSATGFLLSIENAATPLDYRNALMALASGPFMESSAAQRVIDAWPESDRLKALIAFRGDLVALKIAINADTNSLLDAPKPELATAEDRKVISDLTNSEVLNKLWEVEWTDAKAVTYKQLATQELKKHAKNSWTGKLANYLDLSSKTLDFKETQIIGYEKSILNSCKISPTATMMGRLNLGNMLDNTGTQFRSSVLPLLDLVANETKAHPLAKAYVYGELIKLIKNHNQEEWGLQYCPTLIDDMKQFQILFMEEPISERTWLVNGKDELAKKWDNYFTSKGKRNTYTQLLKAQEAAADVVGNDIELAGRASPKGEISFIESNKKRLILAVCEAGKDLYEMKVCGIVNSKGEWQSKSPTIIPFSPILTIDLADDIQEFVLSIHQSKVTPAAPPTP